MKLYGKILNKIFKYYDNYISELQKDSLSFCGKKVLIKKGVIIEKPEKIIIYNYTHIGNNCHLRGGGNIYIGKWCQIASYSIITTANHKINKKNILIMFIIKILKLVIMSG